MVERLGWTLVHFVWEGGLVALGLALALALVRRSAKARYALACAALAALAAAPVLTFRALEPVVLVSSGGVRWTPGGMLLSGATRAAGAMPLLVDLWAVGVVALSLRLLGSLFQVERWRRRHARPADAAWQARFDGLARGLGVRRRVALLVSDRLAVPSAWGVLKAVVVLPASLLTHLPPEQVETILMHELAHVRRHDYLVNLLQAVVETALFYHPAVWWVSGVVRREREHCCDDAVVASLGDPIPYARALLHLEERRIGLPRPTLSAKEGNLMNRIARILSPKPAPRRVSPLASTLAAAAVTAALLGGALQAQAQSKPKAQQDAHPKAVARMRKTLPKKVVARRAPKAAPAKPLFYTIKVAYPTKVAEAPNPIATPRSVSIKVAPARPSQPAIAPLAIHLARPAAPTLEPLPAQGIGGGGLGAPIAGESVSIRGGGGLGGGIAATPVQAAGHGGGFGGSTPEALPAPARSGIGGGFGGGAFGGGGFGGGAFGRSGPAEIDVQAGSDGRVSVDAMDAPLSVVLRRLAREAKLSIVVEPGFYADVTMTLNNRTENQAILILCRAGGATWRMEGDVYYISPAASGTTPAPR